MQIQLPLKVLVAFMLGFLFVIPQGNAQLNQIFSNLFDDILGENSALTPVPINIPGVTVTHADHFKPAARAADSILVPALNNLITDNISSFPLSSTSVGIAFDFSTGRPVSIVESLGPIFAETGKTLGKGKLNFGMNYSALNLQRFRGIRTEDIRFTFAHQDVGPPGLGSIPTESDIMDVYLDLNVNANIFAFYATTGLTKNLDLNIALPVINIGIEGVARAEIHSFTHTRTGRADHHFSDLGQEDQPDLDYENPYSEGAFGIGDMAVRLKYSMVRGKGVDVAALLDVRLPTGNEEDFLGTGASSVRLFGIISKKMGDFTPHVNVGYDYRRGDFQRDEFEFITGFDQKLLKGLTVAFDILGELNLNDANKLSFEYSSEPIEITDQVEYTNDQGETVVGLLPRTIDQTNIPGNTDNLFNAAFGLKFAPNENVILLGNMLLPLNDGGLRAKAAYTLGFAVSY